MAMAIQNCFKTRPVQLFLAPCGLARQEFSKTGGFSLDSPLSQTSEDMLKHSSAKHHDLDCLTKQMCLAPLLEIQYKITHNLLIDKCLAGLAMLYTTCKDDVWQAPLQQG